MRGAGGGGPPIGNALVPKGWRNWWNEKEEGKGIDEKKNLSLMLRLKLLLLSLWSKKARVKESETCTLKKLAYPLVSWVWCHCCCCCLSQKRSMGVPKWQPPFPKAENLPSHCLSHDGFPFSLSPKLKSLSCFPPCRSLGVVQIQHSRGTVSE